MQLLALKDLPDGVKAGERFEANAVIGQILTTVGAACEAEPPEPATKRRTYRRRDLRTPDDYPTTALTPDAE